MEKVLQISKYYYPEVGGIEKIAEAISDSIVDKYEVKVVCFTRDEMDRVDFVNNIEVFKFGTKLKIASQPVSLGIIKALKRLLKEYKPDYVILHEPNPYLAFFTLRYIEDTTKLIVYWHSDIIKQRMGERLLRTFYHKELRRADRVVATSPNYIDGSMYLSSVKDKCVVIPNCINEEQLQITEESHALALQIRDKYKDKIICVGIGRVVPYKGFEYLAKVAQLLDDRYVFFISGRPGESTPILSKMTENMHNFVLLGETTDAEQKAYLEAADIFVFPSITKNEAFGIALAEGMYFGKPAVTFTIQGSGVNYVNINGETGIVVENKNIDLYANALLLLANELELRNRMGNNARRRVENHFLYESFRKNIIELLE